jgi:hypothetical protein
VASFEYIPLEFAVDLTLQASMGSYIWNSTYPNFTSYRVCRKFEGREWLFVPPVM